MLLEVPVGLAGTARTLRSYLLALPFLAVAIGGPWVASCFSSFSILAAPLLAPTAPRLLLYPSFVAQVELAWLQSVLFNLITLVTFITFASFVRLTRLYRVRMVLPS
jgi:hypothetical protein